MNLYEILIKMESVNDKKTVLNIFEKDYLNALNDAKIRPSEQKRHFETYVKSATMKDEGNGIYSDGSTMIYDCKNRMTGEKTKALEYMTDFLKECTKPESFYFLESLAFAKANGWKCNGDEKALIDIGGNCYNFNLLYKVCRIVNPKTHEFRVKPSENNSPLLVRGDNYIGVILPINGQKPNFYNDVSFTHYCDVCKSIEDDFINHIIKTA